MKSCIKWLLQFLFFLLKKFEKVEKTGFLGLILRFLNLNVLHKGLLMQDWVFRLGIRGKKKTVKLWSSCSFPLIIFYSGAFFLQKRHGCFSFLEIITLEEMHAMLILCPLSHFMMLGLQKRITGILIVVFLQYVRNQNLYVHIIIEMF